MKTITMLTVAILLLLIMWAGWNMRPFMRTGQTICLGNWKFDEYELQVWQVKNATFGEPFSTSLYVRHQTNAWHQYYLNHQDNYAQHYAITRTNEIIIVNRDGKTLGAFYLSMGKYERVGGGVSLEDVFWRNPP